MIAVIAFDTVDVVDVDDVDDGCSYINIYSIPSENRKENIIFIISFLATILNTVQNI